MKTQPEALRLAEQLRDLSTMFKTPSHEKGVCNGASFEIRRLHALNQELVEALQSMLTTWEHGSVDEFPIAKARAAIAKATGEK